MEMRMFGNAGQKFRLMRPLTPSDEWHHRTGWIGAEQGAECDLSKSQDWRYCLFKVGSEMM